MNTLGRRLLSSRCPNPETAPARRDCIREKLIPHAVSWYTGEAIEQDDEDDEDDDEEDDDEDDDNDDEDDDEDDEVKHRFISCLPKRRPDRLKWPLLRLSRHSKRCSEGGTVALS